MIIESPFTGHVDVVPLDQLMSSVATLLPSIANVEVVEFVKTTRCIHGA